MRRNAGSRRTIFAGLAEDRNEAAKVETGVARITGPDKEGANLTRVIPQKLDGIEMLPTAQGG
jgi:hypothetical protein